MRNVFEAIAKFGHDEDYIPRVSSDFSPTEAPAGSPEKLAELAPILCETIVRSDRPTILLWYDGSDVHWQVETDEEKIQQLKDRVRAEGHIGIARNPADIRDWITATYFVGN